MAVSGKRVGSTATYSCQPGFILFGQEVIFNAINREVRKVFKKIELLGEVSTGIIINITIIVVMV